MFKQIQKVLIALMMSVLLMSSNALAFHKNGKIKQVYEDPSLTKEQISSNYCALKVTPWKEKQTEGSDFVSQVEKDGLLGWNIENYHDVEPIVAPKKWDFSEPANNNKVKLHKKKLIFLKTSKFIPDDTDEVKITGKGGVSLQEFLKIICLQYDNGERASKFNKTKSPTMYDLFRKIAENNKLIDKNGKPNLKAKLRYSHLKNGLIINEPNTVYYLPDYLIAENNAIEQAKIANNKKIKTENETKDFIAGIKPGLIKEITAKKEKFDQEIKDINNKYTQLKITYENFRKYFKEKTVDTEDILNFVDKSQPRIKKKAKELNVAKREFLNPIILDDLKAKYKNLRIIKSKQYKNYKKLEDLLYNIDKRSNIKKCFQAGKSSGKCKPSFPDQWERIKSSELGANAHEKNLDSLSKDIANAENNIVNNIDKLNEDIKNLEEELGNQFPWNLVIIGTLVLLAVIGIAVYVYFNNKRLSEIRENADKQVGSLKSDLEGKLKDTSEQIKSVGRTAAARAQQSRDSTEIEPVSETPKTPEEIIAAKYDELVSEYKDALEDFSKVAAFKKKWHGLALSRKERQDGIKTILINSNQAFEKSGIWCVSFDERYFAFPGSTVKSNMATYMNMEFMKAGIDFKGIFSISEGSNYLTEPCVLKRGGAGFSVERVGKIIFPN
jgi:hypothetical protein